MPLATWIAFCALDVVLCFIPGPAVLYVVSVALARGARPGLAGACGILAGNAFYFTISATGVAAVILASHRLFAALEWVGAAYLVFVGLRMLLARDEAAKTVRPLPVRRAFVRGFLVQAANPKALMFFVAMVPQFIDPQGSLPVQLFILGVTSVTIEILVLSLYVALAVRARRLAGATLAGTLERVGGAFLVAAGARIALARSG